MEKVRSEFRAFLSRHGTITEETAFLKESGDVDRRTTIDQTREIDESPVAATDRSELDETRGNSNNMRALARNSASTTIF